MLRSLLRGATSRLACRGAPRLGPAAEAPPRPQSLALGAGAAASVLLGASLARCREVDGEVDAARSLGVPKGKRRPETAEGADGPAEGPEPIVAVVNYQGPDVPTGLYAEYVYPPKVGVKRDRSGNDVAIFGCKTQPTQVVCIDGREGDDSGRSLNLDEHGVALQDASFLALDYCDVDQVVSEYYPECCRLVQEATGARKVIAFDHNVRSVGRSGSSMGGGFAVQPPLALVHGDYTEISARNRVRHMTQPPTQNDVLRRSLGDTPPLEEDAEELLGRRFAIINVWRSIHEEPVERKPLGILSHESVPIQDIVLHEIHYDDRIGENYNARHGRGHRWWVFPRMTRDEVMFLKCWDSAGEFARQAPSGVKRVPATFAFHSALEVPTRPDAPDRESIEVRTIAFY